MVSELKAVINVAMTLPVVFFEGVFFQGTDPMQLDWELDMSLEHTKPPALYCLSLG